MPDVRKIPMYAGTELLMRVTDTINRQRTQNRKLDLEERVINSQLSQARDNNSAASVNAQANMLNALHESGYATEIVQEELQQILPMIGQFAMKTKQERVAESKKAIEGIKITGRETLQTQQDVSRAALEKSKIVARSALETQKATAMRGKAEYVEEKKDVRQKRALAQTAALNQMTPAEFTAGLQAVDAADPVKANSLRAGEDFIVVPGNVFSIAGVPLYKQKDMTITNNDIINKIGEENFTDELRDALDMFAKGLKSAKTKQEKKDEIADLIAAYPILGRLFEGK